MALNIKNVSELAFFCGILGASINSVSALIRPEEDSQIVGKTLTVVFGVFIFQYFLLNFKGTALLQNKAVLLGTFIYFSNLFIDPKKSQELLKIVSIVILYQELPYKIKELPSLVTNLIKK
jgi:hypothetical protein